MAQKCYCGSGNCRGLLGGEADEADEEEEEEVCLYFVICLFTLSFTDFLFTEI